MNAVGEPRLGFELEREMSTADKVFMVVSFVQWRGWQRLKTAFRMKAAMKRILDLNPLPLGGRGSSLRRVSH
jgi:hypothetical protein